MTEKALVLFSGGSESATCQACALRAKGWHAYVGGAA
jgi:7-cyano-7-deazaguanine synthase in queuosine biosynthesis